MSERHGDRSIKEGILFLCCFFVISCRSHTVTHKFTRMWELLRTGEYKYTFGYCLFYTFVLIKISSFLGQKHFYQLISTMRSLCTGVTNSCFVKLWCLESFIILKTVHINEFVKCVWDKMRGYIEHWSVFPKSYNKVSNTRATIHDSYYY